MRYAEHALDVLKTLAAWHAGGLPAAIVVITNVVGGTVRRPGAMMAVNAGGDIAGYISGGCIDADVAAQAQRVIETRRAIKLLYGAGSPFVDLPLPCGGAIEILIIPPPDNKAIAACITELEHRAPKTLRLCEAGTIGTTNARHTTGYANDGHFYIRVAPKLRLRIAGRGADCLSLARLAMANGVETELWLLDANDAKERSASPHTLLQSPSALPPLPDDPYTAFILMFHDPDWETPLLMQALAGPAFFIGAVGSPNTHRKRCEVLRSEGISEDQIARITGPVGLIPSMRDASMLAVSALSQIVEVYHARAFAPKKRTALCLLAAGSSSRFENGDKLLAPFNGRPLLSHAADLCESEFGACLAVIGPGEHARRALLETQGWTVIENPRTNEGQSTSLHAAISQASAIEHIDQAIIILGDMPHISSSYIDQLTTARTDNISAVISDSGEAMTAPAIFGRHTFDTLLTTRGDQGARRIFEQFERTATRAIAPDEASDVDTVEQLSALEVACA